MIIDLHGLNEKEAIGEILSALLTLEMSETLDEIEIITGNGQVLTIVLEKTLEEENYVWTHKNNNFGSYIVFKKR